MEPPKSSGSESFGDRLEAEIPSLRRYAMHLARGNRDRADDMVQACLVRALAKQHLWEPGTNLRAWLFTLMHNERVNDVRRAVLRDRYMTNIGEDALHAFPDYRTDPQANLLIRDLERVLKDLPADQRRVIVLVGYYGITYEAAADIEGVPVGTIRSRLSRGREILHLLFNGGTMSQDDLDLLEWAKR